VLIVRSRIRAGAVTASLWLAGITAVALLLRSWVLLTAIRRGPEWWVDPDGYTVQALEFVKTWQYDVLKYATLVKAPLYALALSLFALFPSTFPISAAIVIHVLAGSAAVAALYVIGREIHSRRAGLIAAGIYAVWLPMVGSVHIFLQEQLHVPLVIAGLALLVHAAARSARPLQFGVAGSVLGLAALARSMPLYYLGPAAAFFVVAAQDRRVAVRQAAALIAGFIIMVLPWSAYASAREGQLILIDNMGSAALGMTYREVRPEIHTAPPASVPESLPMLWRAAWRDPGRFWGDRVADFERLFRMVSWQWVQLQPPVATRLQAQALRAVAHTSDALFALSAVLAPIGAVLARRRREATLVVLWVALHLGLLVMFAWNGVRYRAPYEPGLIVLAAIALAGGWSRPRAPVLGLAVMASLVVGTALSASLPEAARARATYGVGASTPAAGVHRASFVGESGFRAFPRTRLVYLKLAPAGPDLAARRQVRIFFDGARVDEVTLEGSQRVLRYVSPNRMTYIELRATFESDDRPAPIEIEVSTPR
jgi:4-amino-4-deoxy-L-arabinose transferase-like glycosyltransferase